MALMLSILALTLSAATAWLTIFHRGTVKMARPHFFALIPEDGPFGSWLKLFMRTLLFSTGKRGRVVEIVQLTLRHEGKTFPFNYWMYGDSDKLSIGSGIFVGQDGIALNHHFVPTSPLSVNDLPAGSYQIEVRALLLGSKSVTIIQRLQFALGNEEANALRTSKDKAVFFVWDQETGTYKSRIDNRRSRERSHSVSGSGGGLFSFE